MRTVQERWTTLLAVRTDPIAGLSGECRSCLSIDGYDDHCGCRVSNLLMLLLSLLLLLYPLLLPVESAAGQKRRR
jgi:hypothetical protein